MQVLLQIGSMPKRSYSPIVYIKEEISYAYLAGSPS